MRRLFLAIRPSAATLDALASYAQAQARHWPDARWTRRENLHLTVCFFGDVEEDRVMPLADDLALSLAAVPPFRLEYAKISFAPPGSRAPTMIWASFRPSRAYEDLARLVRAVAQKYALGMPEEKDLLPHVTLARFRDRQRGVAGLAQLAAAPPPFTVSAVELVESELTAAGPNYSTLEVISLRKTP